MPLLTIQEVKDDLGLIGTDDDAKAQALLDAAILSASNYINRTIPWDDALGAPVDVPQDVNSAIRLEVRALFDESDSVHSAAFKALLNPYRIY